MDQEPAGGLRDEEDDDGEEVRDDEEAGEGDLVGKLSGEVLGKVVCDGAEDAADADPDAEGDDGAAQVGGASFGSVNVVEGYVEAVGDADQDAAEIEPRVGCADLEAGCREGDGRGEPDGRLVAVEFGLGGDQDRADDGSPDVEEGTDQLLRSG